jgi:hypothetical protein
MARHCPACDYHSPVEYDENCPLCGGRLLTDEEHRKGRGAGAGNPDPWYNRRVRVQRAVQVIWIVFTVVLIVALSLQLWQNLR